MVLLPYQVFDAILVKIMPLSAHGNIDNSNIFDYAYISTPHPNLLDISLLVIL